MSPNLNVAGHGPPNGGSVSRASRSEIKPKRVTPRGTLHLLLRLFRLGCWLAAALGIGCCLYMTLRPSSNLVEIGWLPRGVARWADSYGRFRNFPAYAALAAPFVFVCNGRRARAKAMAWLALLGAVVEGLQYFIPTRWCEWQDVAWSWAGLAATWLAAEIGYKVAWRVRCAFKERADPARAARVLDSVLARGPRRMKD